MKKASWGKEQKKVEIFAQGKKKGWKKRGEMPKRISEGAFFRQKNRLFLLVQHHIECIVLLLAIILITSRNSLWLKKFFLKKQRSTIVTMCPNQVFFIAFLVRGPFERSWDSKASRIRCHSKTGARATYEGREQGAVVLAQVVRVHCT